MICTHEIFEVPWEIGGAFECVMVRLPVGGLSHAATGLEKTGRVTETILRITGLTAETETLDL